MELEKKEGIVIKSFDYQENKRILTIFTSEGLLNLIATIYQKNPSSVILTTPLCIAEFCYKRGSSQLHSLKEGFILSSHLNYNQSYLHLETAFSFIQTLFSSQLPEKPAPLLYRLLRLYLEKLPHFPNPKTLASSFMLKTLKHEGLFPMEGLCSRCHVLPSQAFCYGEFYCEECKPVSSLSFKEDEWQQVQAMLFSRDMKNLEKLVCHDLLHQKIHSLFKESL